MQKEVKYAGYTAVPDDYNNMDGELSASLNLIPEDGSMRTIQPPKKVLQLNPHEDVVYIHKVKQEVHYIVCNRTTNYLHWLDEEGVYKGSVVEADDNFNMVTSVGNTLVVSYGNSNFYVLWDGTEYKNLGTNMPDLELSFGLCSKMEKEEKELDTDYFVFLSDTYALVPRNDSATQEEAIHEYSETVYALVNKFIAEKTKKGLFVMPFFVRYAYRLFDGSLTMHSIPVLMAMSKYNIQVQLTELLRMENVMHSLKLNLWGWTHKLDYAIVNPSVIQQLERWKDIIKNVDFFVSPPIYTFNISKDIGEKVINAYYPVINPGENADNTGNDNVYNNDTLVAQMENSCRSLIRENYQTLRFGTSVVWADWYDRGAESYEAGVARRHRIIADINYYSNLRDEENKLLQEIKSTSQFYHIASVKIDDLKVQRTQLYIKEDLLPSLVSREVMTDDYGTHDTYTAKYMYTYNNRLCLANITKKYQDVYNEMVYVPYSNALYRYNMDVNITGNAVQPRNKVQIAIEGNDGSGTAFVAVGQEYDNSGSSNPKFIYYPSKDAKKAYIKVYHRASGYPGDTEDTEKIYVVDMDNHDHLNGSYAYINDYAELTESDEFPEADELPVVFLPNRIYTSEVNNPFYFPAANMNAVGSEEVIALSSAAKALSEGQFGEFPLYAFCTDGVWALSVSQTGGFVAKQPITRDVLTDKTSLCQLDGSVLFGTARGVMELQGSQSLCLTEALDTPNVFSPLSLQGTSALIQHADSNNWLDTFTDDQLQIRAFRDFISHCRMAYDYNNQRVLFFNPDYDSDQNKYKFQYAYVYSITEKAWGMTTSILHSTVNSYPEALAMGHDNALYNLSVPDPSRQYERIPAYILTRPLKLDYPDVLKTIDTIIQRGVFSDAIIRQALYASRDMQHWHLVWSSGDRYLRGFKGTPYKYYRLAVFLQMRKTDSINGITVQFQPRLTNQPR